jgi:hypothetical protein
MCLNSEKLCVALRLTLLALLAIVLSGCANQPVPNSYDPPGFFSGFLHGFLILFSLIGSFFTDVRIYAFPNSGVWYDVGYFLGIVSLIGGGTTAR